jgi:hypothetical protein
MDALTPIEGNLFNAFFSSISYKEKNVFFLVVGLTVTGITIYNLTR